MAPIRVAYFIHSLEQGGAERQLCELIAGLDRQSFAPSLVLGDRRGHFGLALDVPREYLDDPYFPSPRGVVKLYAALERLRPDVIHVWKGWESIVGRVVASRIRGARVVASVRRPRLPLSQRWAERATAGFADLHIVNSFGIRDELVRLAALRPERVVVVESGVDFKKFSPLTPAERLAERARIGVGEGPLWVVVGRLSPEKNQLGVVRALHRLARRPEGLPDGLKVVFAGRDSLWVYGRRVKLEARALGLGDTVRFVGAVDNVRALVGAADFALLPSYFEGLSSAAVESLACATPVILTREANADAVVTDGVNGIELRSPSVTHLTEGLIRALSLDAPARRKLGDAGRDRVETRFDHRRMIASMEAHYEALMRSTGTKAASA